MHSQNDLLQSRNLWLLLLLLHNFFVLNDHEGGKEDPSICLCERPEQAGLVGGKINVCRMRWKDRMEEEEEEEEEKKKKKKKK